ncbi:MAG TPA: DUF1501 domain-containing protein, partial [Pseudomonadota bacterium]|nr:DUF1501 domain-containing protein [Pseudomonadota bacterium]
NRINQAQRDRLASLRDGTQVPRLNRGQAELYLARDPANDLATLAAALPTQAAINAAGNSLQRQAMVAAAGFKTGLAVAANMSIGGFDTHGNHDQNHIPLMGSLLAGIDLVMTEMANAGLAGKVVVCVGSDFGRTPAYNAQNGKDHWNITSMMFMGPGIAGGRVVGGTDANFKAKTFNPSTLAEDPNGIRIQPEHIQKALRSLAGITDSDPARQFPLSAAVQDLRLFTP